MRAGASLSSVIFFFSAFPSFSLLPPLPLSLSLSLSLSFSRSLSIFLFLLSCTLLSRSRRDHFTLAVLTRDAAVHSGLFELFSRRVVVQRGNVAIGSHLHRDMSQGNIPDTDARFSLPRKRVLERTCKSS